MSMHQTYTKLTAALAGAMQVVNAAKAHAESINMSRNEMIDAIINDVCARAEVDTRYFRVVFEPGHEVATVIVELDQDSPLRDSDLPPVATRVADVFEQLGFTMNKKTHVKVVREIHYYAHS